MKTKFFTYAVLCLVLFSIQSQAHVWMLTTNGGAFSQGAIIICNNNGTGLNVAHSFQSPAGFHPYGNLLMASDGNLYGTCYDGGQFGSCTVFRFEPTTQLYSDVYDFNIVDGDYPRSGVVEGPNGKLWGAASGGGIAGGGVIFSYNMNTGVYTDEYDLSTVTGTIPYGSPVLHSNGKLYGMTTSGGLYGYGVIYSYNITTDVLTVEQNFNGTDGSNAKGNLIEGTDGKLYGVTSGGGANGAGVLFSYSPGEAIYSQLFDFGGVNGSSPQGTLMQGTDGKLYGMTSAGGLVGFGVLFSYNPMNTTYTNLFNFNMTDGVTPLGSVTQSGSILCGATSAGGNNGMGVAFNYDLTNSTYTKVLDFNGSNGANPNGGFLEVIMNSAGSQQFSSNATIYPMPATDKLNISFSAPLKEQTTFNMMDAAGRIVYSSSEIIKDGIKTIDVKSLPAGTYLIEVVSGTEKFSRQITKE
jgi:uncharacterized repeat protein (TIGR03803 family)